MADHAFVHVFALAAIAALLANEHIPQEHKNRAWYIALVCLYPFLALEVAIWSFALYMGVQNAWLTTLQTLESFWTMIKTYRDDTPFLNHSTTTPLDLSDALFVLLTVAVAGAAIYFNLLNPPQWSRDPRNVSAARPRNAAEPSSNALPDAVAIELDAAAGHILSPVEGPIREARENISSRASRNVSAARPHNAAEPSFNALPDAMAIELDAAADQISSPVEGPIRVARENISSRASRNVSAIRPHNAAEPSFNALPDAMAIDLDAAADQISLPVEGPIRVTRENMAPPTSAQDPRFHTWLRRVDLPSNTRRYASALFTCSDIWLHPIFPWRSMKTRKVQKMMKEQEQRIEDILQMRQQCPGAETDAKIAQKYGSFYWPKSDSSTTTDRKEPNVFKSNTNDDEPRKEPNTSKNTAHNDKAQADSADDSKDKPSEEVNEDSAVPEQQYEVPLDNITKDFETAPSRPEESEESTNAVDNVTSAPTQNVSYAGGVETGLRSATSSSGSNDGQDGQTSSLAQHLEAPVAAGNDSEESTNAVDNVTSAPTQHVSYAGGVETGLRSATSSSGSNDGQDGQTRSLAQHLEASVAAGNDDNQDDISMTDANADSELSNDAGGQTSSLAQHLEASVAAGNDDNQDDISMNDANAVSELSNDAGEQHQTFASDDAMDILPLSNNGPDTEVQSGNAPVEYQIGAASGSMAGDVMKEAVAQTMPAAPSLAQNLESHSEEQSTSNVMDEDEDMPEVPPQDESQPIHADENDSQPSNFAPAPISMHPPQSSLFNTPMQRSMDVSNAFSSRAAQQNMAGPMFNAAENEPSQEVLASKGAPQTFQSSFGTNGLPPAFGAGLAFGKFPKSVNFFAPSGVPPGPFTTGSIGRPSMDISTAIQTASQPRMGGNEQQSASTVGSPSLHSQAKPFKFDTSMLNLGNSSVGVNKRPTEHSEDTSNLANSTTVVQTSSPRNDQQSTAVRSGQPKEDSQKGVAELAPAQAVRSQDVMPEAASSENTHGDQLHREGDHIPVLHQHAPLNSDAFEGSLLPRNIIKATGTSRRRRMPATSSTALASSDAVSGQKQTKRQVDDAEQNVAAVTSSGDELVQAEEPVRPYVRREPPNHADTTKAQFVDDRPIDFLKDYDIPFDSKLEHARKLMRNWYRDLHASKTSQATSLQGLEKYCQEVKYCYAFFDSDETTAHALPKRKLTADDKISDQQLLDLDTCIAYARELPGDRDAVQDFVKEMKLLRGKMADRRKQWVRDEREEKCQAPEPINDRPKWMRAKVIAACKALVAEGKTALSVENELKDPNSELQQDFLKNVNSWMTDLILFKEAQEDEWNEAIRMSWGRYTARLMRDMEAALRPIVEPVFKARPSKIRARLSNGLYELWDDIREGKVARSLIDAQGRDLWVTDDIPYPISKPKLGRSSGPIPGFMTSRTTAPEPEEGQSTIIRASRPNVNGAATPSVGIASSSKSNESQAHRLGQDGQSNAVAGPETPRGNISPSHNQDMFPDGRNNALLTIEQDDPERERKENLIHQWLTHSSDSFREILMGGASKLDLQHVKAMAVLLQNRLHALQTKVDPNRHFWIPDALLDPQTVLGKARASCRTLNEYLHGVVELVRNKLAEKKQEDAAHDKLPEHLRMLQQTCSDLADADSCFKPERAHSDISKGAAWPFMTVPGLQRYLVGRSIANKSVRDDLSSNAIRLRQDMMDMDKSIAALVLFMRNHRQAWNDMANGVFGRRFLQIMAPFAATLQKFLAPLFQTTETGFEFLKSLLQNLQNIMDDLKLRHPNGA
ncbi:hypothetical protein AC578_4550 [Pseudocercospora eumusae]|uniref:Uncharacterized protein n=1 Tax=Pseudocercospora eumusae TaxID=321146 RepID=A0A139HGM7_9PEZI|nr:hypothetical protein AC578_4550 [Pseudocercospora eumusae]